MTTGFFMTPTAFNEQSNGLFRPANSNTSFGLTQGQSPFGTFGFGQSFAELGTSGQSAYDGFTPFLTPSQFAGSSTTTAQRNNLVSPQVGFFGFDEGGESGGGGIGSNDGGDLGGIGGVPGFGDISREDVGFMAPGMDLQNPGITSQQAMSNALGMMSPFGMAMGIALGMLDPTNPSLSVTGRTGMNPFGNTDIGFDQSFGSNSGVGDIGEVGGFSVGQEDVGFGTDSFGGFEAGLGVSGDEGGESGSSGGSDDGHGEDSGPDGGVGDGDAPGDGGPWAYGGHVTGPGGPRDDKIKARLSNGEYVMDAQTVHAFGGPETFAAMQRMGQGFAPRRRNGLVGRG